LYGSDTFYQVPLAEKLSRVSRLWKTVVDCELSSLNLTHSRWTALWKLQLLGDNVSQKELACALQIELPSLMRTLNQLETHSLITRHVNEQDKRSRIVSLTSKGRQLITQIEERIMRVRRDLLADISNQEMDMLLRLLEKISDNALALSSLSK